MCFISLAIFLIPLTPALTGIAIVIYILLALYYGIKFVFFHTDAEEYKRNLNLTMRLPYELLYCCRFLPIIQLADDVCDNILLDMVLYILVIILAIISALLGIIIWILFLSLVLLCCIALMPLMIIFCWMFLVMYLGRLSSS